MEPYKTKYWNGSKWCKCYLISVKNSICTILLDDGQTYDMIQDYVKDVEKAELYWQNKIIYQDKEYFITNHAKSRCLERFICKDAKEFILRIFQKGNLELIENNSFTQVLQHGGEGIILKSKNYDAVIILENNVVKTIFKFSTSKYNN